MLTHGALHRLAIDRPPVSRAFEFRSLTRAIIPTNRLSLAHKEGAGSKTVLIMQSIVKSLGHMCQVPRPAGFELAKDWQI